VRRIGVDRQKRRGGHALRADAVIIDQVARRERLPGPGHPAAGEHAVRPGVERVEPPIVGTGQEVAARARGVAVAAGLDVPEQRLAEPHRGGLIDDVSAARLRHRLAGQRPQPAATRRLADRGAGRQLDGLVTRGLAGLHPAPRQPRDQQCHERQCWNLLIPSPQHHCSHMNNHL
jgi:hypothetical protein